MVMPATENPLRKRLEQQTVSPRKDQRPLDFYALTLSGLQHPTEKQLPYPLLYDNHGSEMFEEITAVSEYYPTREERKIIIEKAPHLVSNWSRDTIIVELGCGSASKTRHILEAFAKRHGKVHFIAIDISQTALDFAGKELKDLLGEKLQLTPICADYIDGVQRARNMFPTASMAVLWLGGSVGNMVRHNAASFLSQINRVLHPASMVVGIDVWKAPQLLYGAYHDRTGVTERFIRNILTRLNTEMEANFDQSAFEYEVVINDVVHRVEMYLKSTRDQTVALSLHGAPQRIDLRKDERILVEYSHKYTEDEVQALCREAGLELRESIRSPMFSLNVIAAPGGAAGLLGA